MSFDNYRKVLATNSPINGWWLQKGSAGVSDKEIGPEIFHRSQSNK